MASASRCRSGHRTAILCLLLCFSFTAMPVLAAVPPGTVGINQAGDPKGTSISTLEVKPAAPAPFPPGAVRTPFDVGFASEVEPNGTSATATPIAGTSAVVEGNVFPNADVDFYSFTGAVGDRIYAAVMTSFSASASIDSVLDLIAPDGTTVIETDLDDGSFGSTSSSIAGRALTAAGTHFLRVRHNLATAQLRPYRLYFQQRTGAPTPETESNDTFPGQAIPAGGWISGSTSATTDLDFFAISLAAGDTVFISLDLDPERDTVEWNAQTGLGAFGTPPLILVVNDGGTATPDSEAYFMTAKAAGTYGVFVGVPTGGATIGTYHLSVSVFPDVLTCTTYTSTDVPQTIPTGPGSVSSTLTVPGNPRIADMDVIVNLTHNFMADLDVDLTAPAGVGGNSVGLFSDVGSVTAGAQTTMDVTIDDEAGIPIGQFTVVQGMNFTPELQYRTAWFDGQDAGGTWTLTIRDDATADGGTLTGWALRICEPPAPAACPAGTVQTTVYTNDFEAGDGGFTHSGTADEWERGTPTFAPIVNCNSGTNCWKTDLDNTYNASSNQDLLSPNINLAGLQPPIIVNWAQKYQIESATFDHALIEAREVANPANAVRLFEWLGATMTNAIGNPSTTVQEAAGWAQFSARIDSLAGLNSELRFHLDSDTTVQLTGLAIDDVSVTGCDPISADLSITKTDGVASAVPGQSVVYTIVASNAGPDPVTDGAVADTFPAACSSVSYTSVAAGGATGNTAAGAGNIADVLTMPAGSSVTYTATCNISSAATGSLSNTATIASAAPDPDPANNSASDTDTLSPQADLSITKTDGLTNANPGQAITYTVVAANAGPSDAVAATVADTFPAALTGVAWTCVGAGGGICVAGGAGNINDPVTLPPGGSVTFTVNATISGAFSGTLSNTATVTAPGGVADPDPANNSATDSTTVATAAAITGTKTVDGDFSPGGSITYTVILTNNGGTAQADNPGDEFTDVLPAQLVLVSASATSGTAVANVGTNTVTWNGSIPAGGSVTITIDATIDAGASGDISNQGTFAFDADNNGTNESTGQTDDPAAGGAADPTVFGIVLGTIAIPTLDGLGLALLILALMAAAWVVMRRRVRGTA